MKNRIIIFLLIFIFSLIYIFFITNVDKDIYKLFNEKYVVTRVKVEGDVSYKKLYDINNSNSHYYVYEFKNKKNALNNFSSWAKKDSDIYYDNGYNYFTIKDKYIIFAFEKENKNKLVKFIRSIK